jgi:hypothetical protein
MRGKTAWLAGVAGKWILLVVLLLPACGLFGGKSKPAWVDGASAEFPSDHYLLGLGQAESRSQAVERAYAAVSRVFKAEVTSQAKDWESYLVVERRGQTSTERHLTLDQVTNVTTDKVLENVQVLDTWFDPKRRQYYALAGMNRAQADASMVERVNELDRTIQTELAEAHGAQDKLTRVRNLKRAAKNLVLREAYNTDLRVIRSSGQGIASSHRVAELTGELEQFLASHLRIAVDMSGDQAEPVERALIEGLSREGFSTVGHDTGPAAIAPELLVKGTVRLWPLDVNDPQFRYVRWCTDALIEDVPAQRIIGAVSRGGKEGHVTDREATAKAVRVMQQEFSSDLAHAIAGYIYGEAELPVTTGTPPGCPRAATLSKPNP